MLAVISSVGGSVDAMVYLGVKPVFPANMTGNMVLLGVALGRASWPALLGASAALAGFVGIAAASAIVERGGEDAVAEFRWGPGAFALPIVLVAAVVATAAARG